VGPPTGIFDVEEAAHLRLAGRWDRLPGLPPSVTAAKLADSPVAPQSGEEHSVLARKRMRPKS
jgi:hypothetical protein